MKNLNPFLISAMLCLAFAATAQAAPSAGDFVKKASIGNEFEIESSRLALEKSQNANVKQFAQMMIDDHSKAGDQLKATLPSSSVNAAMVPNALDAKHRKLLDKLKDAPAGKKFDKKYISEQTDAHKETVKLFRDYAKNGDDGALKGFASQTLPTLESHLQHVKQIKSSM